MLAIALEAAQAAASLIRDAAPRVREIEWHEKGATDFVSEVDVGAEKTILEIVRRHLPAAKFLAEESASTIAAD